MAMRLPSKLLSRVDLEKFYQVYWKPNNAALIFSGDISLEEAASLAEEVLGSWQPGKVPETEVPALSRPPALKCTWLTGKTLLNRKSGLARLGQSAALTTTMPLS